jgi:hypothetical protein
MEGLAEVIAARRHALAQVPVHLRADGSRYAVVGGLARAYTVVHVNADGSLSEECIHTEAQARALDRAATPESKSPPAAAPAAKKER